MVEGAKYLCRVRSPHSENVLRREAKHDLADGLVVQNSPLALLRDGVNVAQAQGYRM